MAKYRLQCHFPSQGTMGILTFTVKISSFPVLRYNERFPFSIEKRMSSLCQTTTSKPHMKYMVITLT